MNWSRTKAPPVPKLSEPRAPREHARLSVGPIASRSFEACADDENSLFSHSKGAHSSPLRSNNACRRRLANAFSCWDRNDCAERHRLRLEMDAFMIRIGSGTLFPTAEKTTVSIRMQMRTMAKVFRSKDSELVKALLAESQFDLELATAFRERWTKPRRKMAAAVFHEAIRKGELRPDIDVEATIDLLYAPIYYRLLMGTGSLSDASIDGIFNHAMRGLHNSERVCEKSLNLT
jgi:hypothetical protein